LRAVLFPTGIGAGLLSIPLGTETAALAVAFAELLLPEAAAGPVMVSPGKSWLALAVR